MRRACALFRSLFALSLPFNFLGLALSDFLASSTLFYGFYGHKAAFGRQLLLAKSKKKKQQQGEWVNGNICMYVCMFACTQSQTYTQTDKPTA